MNTEKISDVAQIFKEAAYKHSNSESALTYMGNLVTDAEAMTDELTSNASTYEAYNKDTDFSNWLFSFCDRYRNGGVALPTGGISAVCVHYDEQYADADNTQTAACQHSRCCPTGIVFHSAYSHSAPYVRSFRCGNMPGCERFVLVLPFHSYCLDGFSRNAHRRKAAHFS